MSDSIGSRKEEDDRPVIQNPATTNFELKKAYMSITSTIRRLYPLPSNVYTVFRMGTNIILYSLSYALKFYRYTLRCPRYTLL